MAKDKGGHGSEKRGGSGPASYQNVSTKPLISNAAKARIAGWAAPGAAAKANNATWRSAPPSQIERLFSGGGQPVASNAHAAATLAGGPKSASVNTHPAMGLPKGVTMVGMGDPGKMHNAIAKAVGEEAQNRSGVAWGRDRARFHDPASPEYVGKNKRF